MTQRRAQEPVEPFRLNPADDLIELVPSPAMNPRASTVSVPAVEPPNPLPELSDDLAAEGTAPGTRRVCIVSPDLWGPIRNGGVGTLYRNLAFALTEAGHSVTLLYTQGQHSEDGSIEDWIDFYRERGIEFVPVPPPPVKVGPATASQLGRASYASFEWLRGNAIPFDIVHGPEFGGALFYSLYAKRLGLAFPGTTFVVGTHGSLAWNAEGNFNVLSELRDLMRSQMELRTVEMADVVISSSQHMNHWLEGHDVVLPERSFVWPNAVDRDDTTSLATERVDITGVAFFGRLEPRKGIHLFLAALRMLPVEALDGLKVYFLGKRSPRFNLNKALEALEADRPQIQPVVLNDLNSNEALALLAEEKLLAVVPSLLDNSPLVISECITNRLPMLATNVGGDRELLHESCRDAVLFDPTPHHLARSVGDAIELGAVIPTPSKPASTINGVWTEWHALQPAALPVEIAASQTVAPLPEVADVTVCVVHHERPNTLMQALESLAHQTVRPKLIVVVDNGSFSDQARAVLNQLEEDGQVGEVPVQILRGPNAYPGAARNRAVAETESEFLLFADDDNVAKPHQIETFLRAAEAAPSFGAFTCLADYFEGWRVPSTASVNRRALAMGGLGMIGALENFHGDTNALVRRSAFEAIGGFHEAWGVGREDHDLFLRLSALGHGVAVVPEALFFYRETDSRIRHRHFSENAGPSLVAMSGASHLSRDVRAVVEAALGVLTARRHQATRARRELDAVRAKLEAAEEEGVQERNRHEETKLQLKETRSDLRWLLQRLDSSPAGPFLRRYGGFRKLRDRYRQ